MKLSSIFTWFKKESTPQTPRVVTVPNRLQDADEQPVDIRRIPRVISPVLAYRNRRGTNEFEESEYDMAEIGRIEDVECIVQRAFSLKEGLLFKEGYELVGRNPDIIQYIRDRFLQITQASGTPIDLTLHGIGEDLIRYHNSVLVKVRNQKASGGKLRTLPGKSRTLQPVAAYFSAPFPTIKFKRDEKGKILAYRQHMPNGEYVDFDPENVIHFYFRRKKGFLVGTPVLVSIKDDIRALRRIEENIEMLIYQNLFPLFQYVVGTENKPAATYSDGTTEVDVVKANIEIMPSEGMIVTPERHEIRAIGSEGRALRAEGYLQHFKERIIGGVGISAIDLGQGNTANRSTADSMSRNLVDDVKYYQRVMEIFINEYIIKELLLESTFENPLDEENVVRLEFREVDLDAKIKVENHAIQSFTSHLITHSEARKMYGKEPLSEEEWADTYWRLIEEPMNLIKAVDEPYSAAAKALAANPNTAIEQGDLDKEESKDDDIREEEQEAEEKKAKMKMATKKTSGQRQSASRDRPSNQHGRAAGPTKRKSGFDPEYILDEANPVLTEYNNLYQNVMYSWSKGNLTVDWFRQIAMSVHQKMVDDMSRIVRLDFRKGLKTANYIAGQTEIDVPIQMLETRISSYISRLFDAIQKRLESPKLHELPPDQVGTYLSAIFDSLRFRSSLIYRSERAKAYNYGVLIGLQKRGVKKARVISHDGNCDECQEHMKTIELHNASIHDIPGFHPNCKCVIEEE